MIRGALAYLFRLIFGLIFGVSALGSEGFDYSIGAGARTVPKGVSVNGEAGYGRILWGKNNDGEVMYGYVRPVARARTSLVVNAAEAELQIAPVSFFILSAGAGLSNRNVDSATVDCTSADCRGTLGSQFAGGTLLLGARGWVAGTAARVSWIRSVDPGTPDRDFGDEDSALIGKSGGDRLLNHTIFLSRKIDARWTIGAFSATQRMNNTGASNRTRGFFVRLSEGAVAFTAGVDSYESSTQENAPGVFAAMTWTGLEQVGLH